MNSRIKSIVVILAATVLALHWAAAQSTEVSVKTQPPAVVKTVPAAGDTAVDPALKEISVTFSKDMMTNRMWAICQTSKETFPENAGPTHYINQRTCVMPVKLEPGKTYVLWFNLGKFNSFRDTGNHPAVPYQLVFETRK